MGLNVAKEPIPILEPPRFALPLEGEGAGAPRFLEVAKYRLVRAALGVFALKLVSLASEGNHEQHHHLAANHF